MNAVLAGLPASITQSLDDGAGNVIPVQSLQYRVLDVLGVELMPLTPAADFAIGNADVKIDLPASLNTVAEGEVVSLRQVEFQCLMPDASTYTLVAAYAVRNPNPLVAGANSFQTMAHAKLTALGIPGLTAFNDAPDDQLANAMVQAFERLVAHRYIVKYEGYEQNREYWKYGFHGSMELLDASAILALPDLFLKALRQAQVAEADAILAGADSTTLASAEDERLLLHSIGETKKMFKPGIQVRSALSRKALVYVGRYLDRTVSIRR